MIPVISRNHFATLTLAVTTILLVGCGDNKPADTTVSTSANQTSPASTPKALSTPAPVSTNPPTETSPMNPGSPGKPMGGKPEGDAPMMGAGATSMTAEEALATVPKTEPKYADTQKKQDAAEAALKAKPTDPATKKAYVEQTYAYGHDVMTGDNQLPPPQKYRAALALFRRVLKVDPTHAPTLAEKKTMEDIYTQMGRPLPN